MLPGVRKVIFPFNYTAALEQPDLRVGATEETWDCALGYVRLKQVAGFGCAQSGRGRSEVWRGAGCPRDGGLQLMQQGFAYATALVSEGRDEIVMITWEDQLSAEQVGGKSGNKIS